MTVAVGDCRKEVFVGGIDSPYVVAVSVVNRKSRIFDDVGWRIVEIVFQKKVENFFLVFPRFCCCIKEMAAVFRKSLEQ